MMYQNSANAVLLLKFFNPLKKSADHTALVDPAFIHQRSEVVQQKVTAATLKQGVFQLVTEYMVSERKGVVRDCMIKLREQEQTLPHFPSKTKLIQPFRKKGLWRFAVYIHNFACLIRTEKAKQFFPCDKRLGCSKAKHAFPCIFQTVQ